MKCVVCKSTDIEKKQIEEEIRAKNDIVLVPMAVLVCVNCGERYYDQQTMRKIELIRSEKQLRENRGDRKGVAGRRRLMRPREIRGKFGGNSGEIRGHNTQ